MVNRRLFLKSAGLAAGSVTLAGALPGCSTMGNKENIRVAGPLTLRFRPFELQLKHAFTLAASSRTTTPVVLTELEWNGITGYGEASLPPYLEENQKSVIGFLSGIDLRTFKNPFLMEDILEYVDHVAPGNHAAKASFDIALHDLVGKWIGEPWYRLWGLNREKTPLTSFTIGIDTPEVVREKVREAAAFRILKVKLGRDNDREMIETIRAATDVPLCVDVNQGWKDKQMALDLCHWLAEKGVMFVEQPMDKARKEDLAWLTARSPLPIIGDEAVQVPEDILPLREVYSGINIKLMKCGGLRPALKMITLARALDMKVMIGCMTETSCAVTAAAQLSPLVDWADLDGNLLISNDIYTGLLVREGKIVLPDQPGIGITLME